MATLIRSFRECLNLYGYEVCGTVRGEATVADEMTWASLDDETQASIIRLCKAFSVEVDTFNHERSYEEGYDEGYDSARDRFDN